MKLYDVSQLPVLEDSGQVCGILDEEDLLMRVFRDEARFKDPVHQAMTSQLETIQVDRPIEDLLPIFDQGRVAIVVEGTTFLGLITRIDLLNHLRQKVR
jgi:cystathionine beta-synthase